ncbi:MAG: hypothetical protein Hyperionvirus11_51 [Hyperionvirus sp.]|uniref:Uncharacterized protein n=1 Tax=Hyperionvirus sp. TaxID=2487770 RepID=A0A3G5A948_9VIRU|nr:MAG: hypothetical protein Hyperionvirus11_51 [Hyperionvirus sp.]
MEKKGSRMATSEEINAIIKDLLLRRKMPLGAGDIDSLVVCVWEMIEKCGREHLVEIQLLKKEVVELSLENAELRKSMVAAAGGSSEGGEWIVIPSRYGKARPPEEAHPAGAKTGPPGGPAIG